MQRNEEVCDAFSGACIKHEEGTEATAPIKACMMIVLSKSNLIIIFEPL